MEEINLPEFPTSKELYEKANLKSIAEVKVIYPFFFILPFTLGIVTLVLINQNIYSSFYLLFYLFFLLSTGIIFYFLLVMYKKGRETPHIIYGELTEVITNNKTNIIELKIAAKCLFKLSKNEKPEKVLLKENSTIKRKIETNFIEKELLLQKKEIPYFWLSTATGKIVDIF